MSLFMHFHVARDDQTWPLDQVFLAYVGLPKAKVSILGPTNPIPRWEVLTLSENPEPLKWGSRLPICVNSTLVGKFIMAAGSALGMDGAGSSHLFSHWFAASGTGLTYSSKR